MPSAHKKMQWRNACLSTSPPRNDRWLRRLLIALAVALGLVIFVACGGLYLLGFVAFLVVLHKWGESHILPWLFFISVVGGVLALLGIL